MEPVVITCHGCAARVRVKRPGAIGDRGCPRCGSPLGPMIARPDVAAASPAVGASGRESLVPEPGPSRVIIRPPVGLLVLSLCLALVSVASSAATRYAQTTECDAYAAARGVSARPAEGRPFGRLHGACPPPSPAAAVRNDLKIAPDTRRPGPPVLADRVVASPAGPAPEVARPATRSSRRHETTPDPLPPRVRVRTAAGRVTVARAYGGGARGVPPCYMLPDGQLGIPERLVKTDEPFRVATRDEIVADLKATAFGGFSDYHTAHYVILSNGSEEFAESSGAVLEDLYKGLAEAFPKRDMPVADAEFPLVAVIFYDENEFRDSKAVDPEVQAYYDVYTNRISFYEKPARDDLAPEVAAIRRPQTVAHEGTHQILQNIGVQPRLAEWPPWLTEGLAEYCSTPLTTRRGTTWSGLGLNSPFHLATIRDLNGPPSGQLAGTARPARIGRPAGTPLVEYLVRKRDLIPTDYALAWATTHYLAKKRVDEFFAYLKRMRAMPPLAHHTPADHLAAFQAVFGSDLARLDREIGSYLAKMKVSFTLPYYAVCFEQHLQGTTQRAAIVSQSPSMILQWLENVSSPRADAAVWEAFPYRTRAPALLSAEEWVRGN